MISPIDEKRMMRAFMKAQGTFLFSLAGTGSHAQCCHRQRRDTGSRNAIKIPGKPGSNHSAISM